MIRIGVKSEGGCAVFKKSKIVHGHFAVTKKGDEEKQETRGEGK
jgi:hypothetical protein